jgi:hypothetical protein
VVAMVRLPDLVGVASSTVRLNDCLNSEPVD